MDEMEMNDEVCAVGADHSLASLSLASFVLQCEERSHFGCSW